MDFEILFAETVTRVGGALHEGGLIISVVELSGGCMLFEAEVVLPGSLPFII